MRKISVFIFCLFIYSHFLIGQEEIRQYMSKSSALIGQMLPVAIAYIGCIRPTLFCNRY